jgi:hypothetical protein
VPAFRDGVIFRSPVSATPENSVLHLFRIHLIGLPFAEVSIIGYQQSGADEREDDAERNVFSFQFDILRSCSSALNQRTNTTGGMA